jgi:hypothetical protein
MKFTQKEMIKIGVALLFGFAFFIRFLSLGSVPLSDFEANIAIHATQLSSGVKDVNDSNVLLLNDIAVLTYVFGNSNFVVRLFSTLIGSLLVTSPLLFRNHFNKKLLFILSFWMCIDPGLIALSRQLNSSILTLFFGILLLYFYLERKPVSMGIISGLLLLCGASLWFTLLPILLISIFYFVKRIRKTDAERPFAIFEEANQTRSFVVSLAISVVLGATTGFIFPSQFGGVFQGLVDYLQGWRAGSTTSVAEIARALLVYDFPIFVFGVLGIIFAKKWHRRAVYFFGLWFLINTIQLLLYPARQLNDSIWILFPLILFGSFFIDQFSSLQNADTKIILLITGCGIVIFEFLTLVSLNLLTNTAPTNQSPISKSILIIAGITLILFAIFLIGWSLSWRVAGKSILFISIVYFGVYSLSAGWNASGLRLPFENEMWYIAPIPPTADLVISTVEEYSEWNHGYPYEAHVQVVGIDSPSLRWALRKFENVEFVQNLRIASAPEIVITDAYQTITMEEAYKGQDFEWVSKPAWDLLILREWTDWVLTRRVASNLKEQQQIILWVRNDLFPGLASQ